MKTFTLLSLALLCARLAQATHLIGGYIQAKPTAGSTLTYEITVGLYMDQVSGTQAANQSNQLIICFGDGTTNVVTRQSQTFVLNKLVSVNEYRITHTYSAPSTYALTVSISNRTIANNITNASGQLFTLNTTLVANVVNQTPTPGFPEAGFHIRANQKAVISLKATDAEGDSLVYVLTRALSNPTNESCTNRTVPAYLFPNDVTHQGTFKLDSRTGELVWDTPVQLGNYSVALNILEYRNGILISQTTQELTLMVDDLPGSPTPIPPYEPAIEGTVVTGITNYVDADITLTTFPNPVDDWLQVVIQTSNPTTATVQLMDITGRKLHELRFAKASRKHEQVISMGSLTPGIYLLRATIDGRPLLRKVLKK
ncbi:T9SS type A sorting domain-containing protein [Spirosoma sp. KNUC1025]|uniref:T9SS type A sorting domain-containing protein n=1 Tax=Spirosoma sp. KNUC1025 TaxID=2894082 RepID=UPI00386B7427|nr:T9SS type A sorting domain-containing protein [Spirosoma sp. KNUC1025]